MTREYGALHGRAYLQSKLLQNTVADEDCLIWQGHTNGRYGSWHWPRNWEISPPKTGAHRASFLMFKGEIPAGYDVMHSCDRPLCVNPRHLTAGTRADNMQDCVRKGRHIPGKGRPRKVAT